MTFDGFQRGAVKTARSCVHGPDYFFACRHSVFKALLQRFESLERPIDGKLELVVNVELLSESFVKKVLEVGAHECGRVLVDRG
jgi:hypothetical protein